MDEKNIINEEEIPEMSTERLARRVLCAVKGSNRERFCFILGSGVCIKSGVPEGSELEYQWMQELMGETPVDGCKLVAEEVKQQAAALKDDGGMDYDFTEIVEHWEKRKQEQNYKLNSEYYFDIFNLREYVTGQDGTQMMEREVKDAFPSYGFVTLAKLLVHESGNNLVITTNFDNLVEQALSLFTDAVPITINHEATAEFIDNQNLKTPLIGKIHRGSGFGTFNKPYQTKGLQGKWEEILSHFFLTYTPIVIGYGGGDKSLMSYLEGHELRNGIIWCAYQEKPNNERICAAVKKSNGCFVLHNGFDDLMTEIGNLVFGDEVVPQKVCDMLKARADSHCKKLIESYNDFMGSDGVNTDGSPDSPTPSPSEPQDSPESPETPESSAAAELKRRTKEEDDKREKEGKLSALDYFIRAYELAEQKDYDGAIENYAEAIKLDPKFAAAYYNRGNAYAGKGDYDKALEYYDKAIDLDLRDAAAYYNRGNAYKEIGEYDKALADYDEAVKIAPNYKKAKANRDRVRALLDGRER